MISTLPVGLHPMKTCLEPLNVPQKVTGVLLVENLVDFEKSSFSQKAGKRGCRFWGGAVRWKYRFFGADDRPLFFSDGVISQPFVNTSHTDTPIILFAHTNSVSVYLPG